jgi:hypothetical protein
MLLIMKVLAPRLFNRLLNPN